MQSIPALLTFGYNLRYRGIVNVFLGTDKSVIIMRRKIQGPNLVPRGTPDGTLAHSDNQYFLSLPLWDLSERKSITQLIILFGTFISFNFVTKIL